MIDPQVLLDLRAELVRIRERIEEVFAHWPPNLELAELLRYDLGYALHVADALEERVRDSVRQRRDVN